MRDDFSHIETWVFDLDNTLYPPQFRLFDQIEVKMTAWVMRELGVGAGRQGIALPLFTFNLGVEVGQVAIAAVVLPIVWRLRKNEAFVRRGVPALSALVVLAGLYWLLERTGFG